jgi:orotate phosphoribosyltransferase
MNEKVAEAILDTPECFKSRSSKPSILSSRQLTPYYINPKLINSYPEQRDIVVEEVIDRTWRKT